MRILKRLERRIATVTRAVDPPRADNELPCVVLRSIHPGKPTPLTWTQLIDAVRNTRPGPPEPGDNEAGRLIAWVVLHAWTEIEQPLGDDEEQILDGQAECLIAAGIRDARKMIRGGASVDAAVREWLPRIIQALDDELVAESQVPHGG